MLVCPYTRVYLAIYIKNESYKYFDVRESTTRAKREDLLQSLLQIFDRPGSRLLQDHTLSKATQMHLYAPVHNTQEKWRLCN